MSDVILCNGKTLHISPSLNAALKTFRGSAKLQDQLLWSDAVSIDQSNLTEVSEQIPLMRRIYTEATGVFVHLGLPESQISRGLGRSWQKDAGREQRGVKCISVCNTFALPLRLVARASQA